MTASRTRFERSPSPTRPPPEGLQRLLPAPRCRCPSRGPVAWVNGVRIDAVPEEDALARLSAMVECGASHVVNHIPAHPTVVARTDPPFRDALNAADLNVADGIGVVWACRLQGHRQLRRRVYGPDFMLAVLDRGQETGLSHSFVGTTPETLERLVDSIERRFPRVRVVSGHAPPFRDVTPEAVAEDVAHLGAADVLWVGLGTPKQQLWGAAARGLGPARVIVTVGAAFDFIAGTKRQAPPWIRNRGFEWAFRLAVEPGRLWKRAVVDNGVFAWHVLADTLARRKPARRESARSSGVGDPRGD